MFTGVDDGANPLGSLTFGWSGALYGTSLFGGALGGGTVFELAPPASGTENWTLNVVHSFGAAGDGSGPCAGVVFDKEHNLFGTTASGGASQFWGTVFKLRRAPVHSGEWIETVLFSFDNGADGGEPFGSLIFDKRGDVYGTSGFGGVFGHGTVFELVPTSGGGWVQSVLYSFFDGTDGGLPNAGLILDGQGDLYGTAESGGEAGAGTAFELKPPLQTGDPWTQLTLYSFSNSPDGAVPQSPLVFGPGGDLYGTTWAGGNNHGTVFQVAP